MATGSDPCAFIRPGQWRTGERLPWIQHRPEH